MDDREAFAGACRRRGLTDEEIRKLEAVAATASFAVVNHFKQTVAAMTADLSPEHRVLCAGRAMMLIADGLLASSAIMAEGLSRGTA